MNVVRLVWKCKICGDVVLSYSNIRHQMDYCECGSAAVDLEAHYQRNVGHIEEFSRKEFVEGEWKNIK